MNLVHPCVILLLVIIELVVKESQVGGKVIDAFTHCLLLLMQSTLCTKEVSLGEVGVHVIVVLNEEWVGRSTWPIHHEKVVVSRKNERTKPKLPFPKIVDVTSTISRCYNRGIGTGNCFSHLQVNGLWRSLVRKDTNNSSKC